MKIILTSISVFVILVYSALGITIFVPEDYPTIGEAISAASDGDSILVGPGIYDPAPTVYNSPNNITLLGNGYMGSDRTTIIGGSEEEGKFDLRNVTGWEIGGFELTAGKKGINTYQANDSYFHDLYVHDVTWSNADGVMVNSNNITIERCIFEGCPSAGIEIFYPFQTGHIFRNNTIINCNNGILIRGSTPDLVMENNIIAFNSDGVEFVGSWTGSEFLDYNDVYGSGDDDWYGCTPGPNNISADPMFIGGTGAEQYMLLPNSPCIDAGNPTSPLDPDGTIADIGCFYFDQNYTPGNLTIDLEPVDPPVIVPAEGGSFDITLDISCDETNYAIFDFWMDLTLPDGQTMGPLVLRYDRFIAAGASYHFDFSFYVSTWAMPGVYEFHGYLGEHPNEIYAEDFFEFEKETYEGSQPDGAEAYAILTCWDEEERIILPVADAEINDNLRFSSNPNPFNPLTTLQFSLPAAEHTTLKVYDLAGRTVATIIDRKLEAGEHKVQFNANHLTSGVYLAVLESGNNRITERLLLIK